MLRRLTLLLLSTGVLFQTYAAHKELKPGWNLFSKEQDVQLGREAAAQVEQQMPIVRDGTINNYVQNIGRRLASQPQAGGYPYTFKVVSDNNINAFALPGGPTYVHTGLIAAAENEAQLAGVMAHEIAHVALRHGTNQASKANLLQIPAMLAGAVVGNSGSILGQLTQLGIGLGFNSVLLKYSRSAENDADLLGAQMMAAAGYNPIEMARFFEKLEAQGGSRGPQFLSSHPDPGNRVTNVQNEVRTLPQRNYTVGNTNELRNIQSRLGNASASRGAASADRSSVDPGAGRPSGQMREFRTNLYSIAVPENWQAFGGQDSNSVTLAPRQGIVQSQNGGSAIGYGAIVSMFDPRGNRPNLEQDTRYLIQQLGQNNPNMRQSGQQRRMRIGGQQGLVTTLESASPYGGQELDMLVTLARPEGLFYIVFIAPANEYQNVQSTFEQMLRTLRFN